MMNAANTPHANVGPDGYSYLALDTGEWCRTFAQASAASATVVQRCMVRGVRYGSEWTVKGPL